MMRKAATLVLSFLLLAVFTSCARTAGVRSEAAAGKALVKILPRSTAVFFVLDIKRLMEIDVIVNAMQDPKFKQGYDEFVNLSGIDPKRDGTYLGFGTPLLAMNGTDFKNMAMVFNLKYDQARLKGLIKEKDLEAKEEMYNGVAVYSGLDGDKAGPTIVTPTPKIAFAFLDASRIVLGDDKGVKGVIDVYRKKAEPLARNAEMTALVGRVDKSGIAWGVSSIPPGAMKTAVNSNPMLKAFEGLKGTTIALDDWDSKFVADIRYFCGTKEQNATVASILNGFKAAGAMLAAQEPALAELLNGVIITSAKDYTRMTLTVSHETLGKLGKLVESAAKAEIKKAETEIKK